jgi:glycosyltransferase involved in cell wall biosynthesis
MGQLLIETSLRERLVQRGYEQARKFTWEEAAQRLIRVYRQVAAGI